MHLMMLQIRDFVVIDVDIKEFYITVLMGSVRK